uniref:Fe2OG dioxygenase domain-containing protein n=2 Tax=Macrostomum lignano TaxID=282301 RepID=A0A1I8I2Q1_9PLAT
MGKHRTDSQQQQDASPDRAASSRSSKRKKDKSKKKEKKSKSSKREGRRDRSPSERKRRHRRSSSKSASPAPDSLKRQQRKRARSSSDSPLGQRHREGNSRDRPRPAMPSTGRGERARSPSLASQIPLPAGPPPAQQPSTAQAPPPPTPPPPPPPATSASVTAAASPFGAPAPQQFQLNPSAADFVPQLAAFNSPPPQQAFLSPPPARFCAPALSTPTILSPPLVAMNFSVPPPPVSIAGKEGDGGSRGGNSAAVGTLGDRSSDAEQPADLPDEFLQLGGNLLLSKHYHEPDSSISYFPNFLSKPEADNLFQVLLNELEWRQRDTLVRGEYHREPRLTCWFGVPYTYSGVELQANHVWHPLLADLKDRLVHNLDASFNSLLCNLYRSGRDSIGWHADDEKSLGRYPLIASISLGYERQFEVKTKRIQPKFRELNEWGRHLRLPLRHGSLLVMRGAMQVHWLHSVPKDQLAFNSPTASRINLTFRYTHPD